MKRFILTIAFAFIVLASSAQTKEKPKAGDSAKVDTLVHFKPITKQQFNLLFGIINRGGVVIDQSDIPAKDRVPLRDSFTEVLNLLKQIAYVNDEKKKKL